MRTNCTNKLKLIFDIGDEKVKAYTYKGLKNEVDEKSINKAASAIASLRMENLGGIHEIIENNVPIQ